MKQIAILGSTGSIGRQALDVIRSYPERLRATVLTAHRNIDLLEQQIEEFQPLLAVVTDTAAAERLRARYVGKTRIRSGPDALVEAGTIAACDVVLTAVSGAVGIQPTLAAIAAGKDIALANKETLVAAGELVMEAVDKQGVALLPVDSEHSAIFQCLETSRQDEVAGLILTASGGPFRGKTKADLAHVTLADCLRHPTWRMGPKITVDSATLFNKGLEVIEAHHLFMMPYERIRVAVHPQSIVHSMVEYVDGAVLAQLGTPDMKLPIQLAFSYPERWPAVQQTLSWEERHSLTFEVPDTDTFPALALAYRAGRAGKSLPLVMNAANEVAVHAFLEEKISFLQIYKTVETLVQRHRPQALRDIHDVVCIDREIRHEAKALLSIG